MITYKLGNLQQIINTFDKWNAREYGAALSFRIAKISAKLIEDVKLYNDTMDKLKKKFAEQDQKGQLKTDEQGNIIFKDEKAQKNYFDEIQAFIETESEIDAPRIKLSQLEAEGVKVAPMELKAIEEFIEADCKEQ